MCIVSHRCFDSVNGEHMQRQCIRRGIRVDVSHRCNEYVDGVHMHRECVHRGREMHEPQRSPNCTERVYMCIVSHRCNEQIMHTYTRNVYIVCVCVRVCVCVCVCVWMCVCVCVCVWQRVAWTQAQPKLYRMCIRVYSPSTPNKNCTGSAQEWTNRTLISHERTSVYFLVLSGSLLSITEIT